MSSGNTGVLQIGNWLVNPALDSISHGAETRKLEPRTMRLLMCLANAPGDVVSVETLLTDVWTGVVVGSASVYQAISQLRKLLDDTDPEPTYIATVPRRGYRLVAAVRRVDTPPAVAVSSALADAAPAPLARRPLPRLPNWGLAAVLAVLLLTGAALWLKWPPAGRHAESMASIVVLPFVDMTADKSDQFFCDGLTEELSTWLSQIPTLKVVARTSAFAFRGQSEDVRKIGTALDTNHVLEGSIRRFGDHMRITVQLIDARNGYHLWSADYDRPKEDIIKIQEDISRSVAENLQIRLTAESDRQFAARRTADIQAYDLYLLARHYTQLGTLASIDRSVELYRQVVNQDPDFAPGYVALAYGILNQGYLRGQPAADTSAQMEPLIASALRLDDRLSGAYAVRGRLRWDQRRIGAALADSEHAIALNPSDMGAIAQIGRIHLFDGHPRLALENYNRAATLDPLNQTLQIQRCVALQDLARYAEAASACERARVLQPSSALVIDALAWLAESRGELDDALRRNAESIQAEPDDDFSYYWTRSKLYLGLGLAAPARKAVEAGRNATRNDDDASAAMARVVYCEGGADALRKYVETAHLDQSTHAFALFEAAYSHLLFGDVAAVKGLLARALVAPDREPGLSEIPWYARGTSPVNSSYRIDLAAADLALGDRASAQKELHTVLTMLDDMIASGVERHAVYELRAKAYALLGRGDDAMRDLEKAARLGWYRAFWAKREPYFAILRPRSDFQALLTRANRSNEQLLGKLRID